MADEMTAFDVLDTISLAWDGKQMYFQEEDGSIYSRYDGFCMTLDDAVTEFANRLAPEDYPFLQWRDPVKDPPPKGERVLVDVGSFVGEAYMNASGHWIRYGAIDMEMMFNSKVKRWMQMPSGSDGV